MLFSIITDERKIELATRIEAAKSSSPTQDVLQNITVDLAKMTKNLAEATGSLPSYDQRQYENVRRSKFPALSSSDLSYSN